MLHDKVALITGASSGIGRACALLFAKHGAAIVAGARRKAELGAVVDEIHANGGRACGLAGNVCDEAYAQRLVAHALECFGGLDIALNNAGTIGALGPTTGLSTADWNNTIATNLTSAFFGARAQVPALLARGGGSLIFTATFVGHTVGFPQAAAYAASKSGVIGFTRALAAEYGPQGLRVNALLPGGTDTPMAHEMNGTPKQWPSCATFMLSNVSQSQRRLRRRHCFSHPRRHRSSRGLRCLSMEEFRSRGPEANASLEAWKQHDRL